MGGDFEAIYSGMRHPVRYHGMLIGRGLIPELWNVSCCQPVWRFRRAYELIFRNGELVKEIDQSDRARKMRKELGERALGLDSSVCSEELRRWHEPYEWVDYYRLKKENDPPAFDLPPSRLRSSNCGPDPSPAPILRPWSRECPSSGA